MKLMTADLRTQLPQLYSQEEVDDPKAIAKFFTPDSNWTWYATEFDGKDTFFGLVDGFEKELGYFSLKELESIRGAFGLPIERDLWFEPTPLSEGLRATVPSCVVDDEAEQKRLEMELKVAMLSAKEKLCSVPCAR